MVETKMTTRRNARRLEQRKKAKAEREEAVMATPEPIVDATAVVEPEVGETVNQANETILKQPQGSVPDNLPNVPTDPGNPYDDWRSSVDRIAGKYLNPNRNWESGPGYPAGPDGPNMGGFLPAVPNPEFPGMLMTDEPSYPGNEIPEAANEFTELQESLQLLCLENTHNIQEKCSADYIASVELHIAALTQQIATSKHTFILRLLGAIDDLNNFIRNQIFDLLTIEQRATIMLDYTAKLKHIVSINQNYKEDLTKEDALKASKAQLAELTGRK